MYQEIDDIEDVTDETPEDDPVNRLKIIALILIGLAVLLSAVLLSSSPDKIDPDISDYEIAYGEYTKAMTESEPALRRARLIDFIETHPSHDRVNAAKAQLAAINTADDADWASLTDVVYDTSTSRPVKLAAIELYEELWGSYLLGGREADLARLRSVIAVELQPDDETSGDETGLDFTPEKDSFDPALNGTEMAGGVTTITRSYNPPIVVNLPRSGSDIVSEPRIRKNVKPRYPSRALRREVNATVVLALNIDEDGDVRMTELVSVRANRYHRDFIKAAERAAMRTKYYPKTINGKAVAASGITKRYVFRIE